MTAQITRMDITVQNAARDYNVYLYNTIVLESADKNNLKNKINVTKILSAVAKYETKLLTAKKIADEEIQQIYRDDESYKRQQAALAIVDKAKKCLDELQLQTGIKACYW